MKVYFLISTDICWRVFQDQITGIPKYQQWKQVSQFVLQILIPLIQQNRHHLHSNKKDSSSTPKPKPKEKPVLVEKKKKVSFNLFWNQSLY